MAEMTSRERLLTACRRGVPDRVPRTMGFERGFLVTLKDMLKRENPGLDVETLDLNAYFGLDPRWVGLNPTQKRTDFSSYFDRKGVEYGEWGNGQVWDASRHYAEYVYPLAKAETLAEVAAIRAVPQCRYGSGCTPRGLRAVPAGEGLPAVLRRNPLADG
ncbi:MAG: hypothetical protein A3K19_26330 [Lentisphaerae bacterium RIFOXYB12_FULL_65_16]|nr:MAG: hypothetical protein A3K18_08500 [Lentisphaerae bacterium RIFOXYA12_64_32]OGV87793.1 MAG: hypothetical protein A3K19_26330 [Lentisphaerae bacterium RIFOXYB12_FULL_65_16]